MGSANRTSLAYIRENIIGVTPNNSASATNTLQYNANFNNGNTVTIGGKVYTFQDTLTDVDGHVKIGATKLLTAVNLQHAINHSGGVAGTDYALSTTAHPTVSAGAAGANTLVITALTVGAAANAIVCSSVAGHAGWANPTMVGGLDFSLTKVRFTGESLKYDITNTTTAEIRDDRSETDTIQTGATASGGVNFEFSFGTFRDLLAGAMCNNWISGGGDHEVLTNDDTLISYTLQKWFQDMPIPEYHTYLGMVIDQLSLKFAIGKMVEGSLTFMGLTMSQTASAISGAIVNEALTNPAFNASAEFQNFSLAGVPYTGCISTMSMDIKNNMRAIQCLGTLGARDVKVGTLQITGDLSLYFSEGSQYDVFMAGTAFSLSFDLVDTLGNKYTFLLPRVKYESAEVVAGGSNTDVMLSGKFRALRDPSSGVVLSITADPV